MRSDIPPGFGLGGTPGPRTAASGEPLVRLLAAARDARAPLDPAREAAALAAFRAASAERLRRRGRLRVAFARMRAAGAAHWPRMKAATVVSVLALGGVAAFAMAGGGRAFAPGAGTGTAPVSSSAPAAAAPDGATAGTPWTAAPAPPGAPASSASPASRPPLVPPPAAPGPAAATSAPDAQDAQDAPGYGHGRRSGCRTAARPCAQGRTGRDTRERRDPEAAGTTKDVKDVKDPRPGRKGGSYRTRPGHGAGGRPPGRPGR